VGHLVRPGHEQGAVLCKSEPTKALSFECRDVKVGITIFRWIDRCSGDS